MNCRCTKARSFKIFCVYLLGVFLTVSRFLLFNVHFSPLYVMYQASLYPANITISQRCTWAKPNSSFHFQDYKPRSFVLISRMLSLAYKRHGILPIIRDGSLLHTFREIQADMDMDVYLIVPRHMTMLDAYTRIRSVIRSEKEFINITFETQPVFLTGLFFQKSDALRLRFNGKTVVNVNVLHETFLNDPDLQAPCLKQMHCKGLHEYNDTYIQANSHHLTTKNLFQSLCACNYMDSMLFCFDKHAAKYLEIKYGKNYTRRVPGDVPYQLIYERPKEPWRGIVAKYPSLKGKRPAKWQP